LAVRQTGSIRWIKVLLLVTITVPLLLAATAATQAAPGTSRDEPAFQDPTGYPVFPTLILPTDDASYPPPGDVPGDVATPTSPAPFPTNTQGAFFPTSTLPQQQFTPFPQQTQTSQPNTFLTENAEMGEGQVTPPANETPSPVVTPTITPTPPEPTAQPTPISFGGQGGSGRMNWGLFWLGFSLPVLAACGWVLYLLDRRPELFRAKS
jgi:hypothetical protein